MTIFRRSMIAALILPAAANASGFQNLDAVDETAQSVAGGEIRRVDRRLKLAACPDALVAAPPSQGTVIVRCPALGWRIRILTESDKATAANTPIIIKRGDPVSVNFVAPGFSVTTNGIAESEARIGERVRVRVEQKANPVMGEVIDAGSVRVGSLN